MDLKDGERQAGRIYILRAPRPRSNINSTRQGAPICQARGRIATPGEARETTICVGYVSAREALDGVSTGRNIRQV